jgi:signal transduction histidine kinase
LTSITEKRLSLHRRVKVQHREVQDLKAQLASLQHLANMGTVSYMIAHEMNNLLAPMKSYASLALSNLNDPSLIEKALQKAVANSERASKIMESMLALAGGKSQEKKTTPLRNLVEEVFTCLCRDFAKDGITVNTEIPDELAIQCVPVQIQQVLMNLILNARDAMLPRGGVLTIMAAEKTDSVEIKVTDTGSGIAPADLSRIFETFFTTKNKGRKDERTRDESPLIARMSSVGSRSHSGSGLGLAFCKMIVDGHEGCISVESTPGQGSSFRITLPQQRSGNG